MLKEKTRVEITSAHRIPLRGRREILEAVCRTIEEHIADTDPSRQAHGDLKVDVQACEVFPLGTNLRIVVSGTLNGEPVQWKVGQRRPIPSAYPWIAASAATGGDFGAMIAEAIAGAVEDSSLSAAKRKLELALVQNLRYCTADICLAIDRTLRRPLQGAARRWRWIWTIAAALGVLFGAATVAVFYLDRHDLKTVWTDLAAQDVVMSVLGILFFGGPLFGAISLLGLATLPSRFLREEPRGLKLMSQTGAQSVGGLRFRAGLAGLFFLLVTIIWLAFSGFMIVNWS
jgi:hypothetical protein